MSDKIHKGTQRIEEVYIRQCEELLEEIKEVIAGVKEVKQRVRHRKECNINMMRKLFATLCKAQHKAIKKEKNKQ